VSESDELLGFALEALDEIDVLVGHGRHEFAASLERQRARAFCWVAVGSALKDYTPHRAAAGPAGALVVPIRFRDRLAHQALSQLDSDLLWRVSTERVAELRVILISLRASGQ
jgi:hypothetical protein